MMTLSVRAHRIDARTRRPSWSGLLRSEAIKLFSLPTSLLALGAIAVIGIGGPLFLGLTLESSGVPSTPSLERTIGEVTAPMVILGQIIAGILGVMCIGAEYSSGTIQPTLLAVPTRLRMLMAKACILFLTVTATALVTVLGAWAVTDPLYARYGLDAALTAPGVAIALIGAGVYLGLCAVFGLGNFGALVRSSTTGSILVFIATLLGPVLSSLLSFGLVSRIARLMLIGNAGDAMARYRLEGAPFLDLWAGYISPGAGWMLATAWTLVALAAGAIVLTRRDA